MTAPTAAAPSAPSPVRAARTTAGRMTAARTVAPLLALLVLLACDAASDPVRPPPAVASVAVTPASPQVAVGRTLRLRATPRDVEGQPLEDRPLAWATSDAAVATVDAEGTLTAHAPGVATVSAATGGRVGRASVTVVPVAVARIDVTPAAAVLAVGGTRAYAAVVRDADGTPLEARPVAWSVEPAQVATIDAATGVLTARAPGAVTVTARAEGVAGSVAATVTAGSDPASEHELLYQLGDYDRARFATVALGAAPVPLDVALAFPGAFVMHPTPTADGRRLAFVVARYTGWLQQLDGDLYVVDRDGSGLRRLTSTAGLEDQPAWSPDGTRIAYRRAEANGRIDLWVADAAGQNARNLTADLPAGGYRGAPAWSPDGSRLAYASDQHTAPFTRIWTMRADGGDRRRVSAPELFDVADDADPTWSPDGTRIAFRRIAGTPAEYDVAIVPADGGGAATVLPLPGVQLSPAWSPDGSLIAFASDHEGGDLEVYTMRADGRQVTRRTSDDAETRWVRWIRRAASR